MWTLASLITEEIHHERPAQRPRKPKNDDDDDEPTYVDEETNETISKKEYEEMVRREAGDEDGTDQAGSVPKDSNKETISIDTPADEPKFQQKVAEIGNQKKRKQVKVVGEEKVAEPETVKDNSTSNRKPKAKKKKIKLSFDEPNES